VSRRLIKSVCVCVCVHSYAHLRKKVVSLVELGMLGKRLRAILKRGKQRGSAAGEESGQTAESRGAEKALNATQFGSRRAHTEKDQNTTHTHTHTHTHRGLIGSADKSQTRQNHPGGTAFILPSPSPAARFLFAACVCVCVCGDCNLTTIARNAHKPQ